MTRVLAPSDYTYDYIGTVGIDYQGIKVLEALTEALYRCQGRCQAQQRQIYRYRVCCNTASSVYNNTDRKNPYEHTLYA